MGKHNSAADPFRALFDATEHCTEEALELFALGHLGLQEQFGLEAHMQGCQQCASGLAGVRNFLAAFREVAGLPAMPGDRNGGGKTETVH